DRRLRPPGPYRPQTRRPRDVAAPRRCRVNPRTRTSIPSRPAGHLDWIFQARLGDTDPMDGILEPKDPDFSARVRASFARQRVMAALGVTLVQVDPGRVELELAFDPELTQQHGFMHAGIIATALDSA